MSRLEIIELYPSPWSERLRWVLERKGLAYARRAYQPFAGEDELRRTTGLSTVPVLLADGEVVGDSDAAVDWLEARHPTPALLPAEPRARAAVRAWELAATEALGPLARLVAIGRYKQLGLQPLADSFATKYGWSPAAEARAARVIGSFLTDLACAVTAPDTTLVGDAFTRADLTVACMLAGVLGHPSDELFAVDDALRPLFGLPLREDPALRALHAWRDATYRRHRGGRVVPPA